MKRYYDQILRDSERRFESHSKNQILDKSDAEYGAVYKQKEYTEPKITAYPVSTAISIYLNKDSAYYKSEKVYNFVMPALDYIAKNQREDGTFDLVDCNFYSAPDTAFIIKRLVTSYHLLKKFAFDDNFCKNIEDKLKKIIEFAVSGILKGGFHTPNHRWVIASILAMCVDVVPHMDLMRDINAYLAEGVDCNEDGEYAERSAATYNVVNNSAMLSLYEVLGDEVYFSYMCRNLDMMLCYFEPDGSIFTDNSTRQDKGKKHYPRDYFYAYLYAAQKSGRAEFDAAAHKIICDQFERRERKMPDCLDLLMLHPDLLGYEFKSCGFPQNFERHMKSSGLVRIKNQNYSASIIKNSTKVATICVGKTMLYLKIGVSYFDQRNFVAQSLEKVGGSYHLTYGAKGWYYMPFSDKPKTSDWWAMDNESREKIYKNEISFLVCITPTDSGIDVSMKAQGCDRVMVRFEIGVPSSGYLDGENLFMDCVAGSALLLKSGTVNVHNQEDIIEVGPGFASHKFLDGKFGSEERSTAHQTIYFTATTNFEKVFSMKNARA